MDAVASAIERLNAVLGRCCSWLLLPVVALAFSVVALRYAAGVGYPWLSELYTWLNGAVVLLATADVLRGEGHVRVDIFYRGASVRTRAWIDLLGVWLLLMPMVAAVGYLAWPMAVRSVAILEHSPTPDGLPFLYVLKLLVVAFCVLVGLQGMAMSIRALGRLRSAARAGA